MRRLLSYSSELAGEDNLAGRGFLTIHPKYQANRSRPFLMLYWFFGSVAKKETEREFVSEIREWGIA